MAFQSGRVRHGRVLPAPAENAELFGVAIIIELQFIGDFGELVGFFSGHEALAEASAASFGSTSQIFIKLSAMLR